MHTTTLVLGAGFAGLAAATRLRDRGVEVHVVEARDRVGGRTHTSSSVDDVQIDLGGQWFGPTQTRMYELAAEHGVPTFPLAEEGDGFVRVGDQVLAEYPAGVTELVERIDALAATVDLEDPSRMPDALALDSTTLHSWLREQASEDDATYVGRLLAGALLAKDAREVSVLQVAYYVRSGSGTASLLSTRGGAQQDRVVGGPQAIASKLAEDLGADAVSHGFVVERLQLQDGRWTVTARDGRVITADRVVCAIPAPFVPRLDVSPALPSHQRRAFAALTTGHAHKLHAVYPRPFWREQGRSGVFTSSHGWITEAVDNSVPGSELGVLTFFLYGDQSHAASRLSEDERRRVVLDELVERFGDERLREPLELVDFSWDDEEFTGGCFSSSFAVGSLHRGMTAIREPWHGLHFAGTESAQVWNGYFEGAVRSGERAADEVVQSLGSPADLAVASR